MGLSITRAVSANQHVMVDILCEHPERGAAMVTSQAKAEQQSKGLVDFEQNLEHK